MIATENKRKPGRPRVYTSDPVALSVSASERKLSYAALKNAGVPERTAKRVVGYSPRSKVVLTGTTDQQREAAAKALDITIYSQLKTLKQIRDDKRKTPSSDRISAVKTINTMMPGFVAPSEIKINSTAVMMEFTSLSSQDLAQLADILHVNTSVPNQCTDITEQSQVIDFNGDSDE